MLKLEEVSLQKFKSNFKAFVKYAKVLLSKSFILKKIAIDLSPLLNQPYICLLSKNNIRHISIEKFLELCAEKWQQEINYQREIFALNTQVMGEFNKIYKNLNDTSLQELLKQQSKKVTESIFEMADLDNKHVAGDFCKGLMNSAQMDLHNKIGYYAFYVLWDPFLIPYPLGLIEYMKEILNKEANIVDELSIVSVTTNIIQYIKKKHAILNLKTAEITSAMELKKALEKVTAERKLCTILIEKLNENQQVIMDQKQKILKKKIKMSVEQFTNENIPFVYDELELYSFNKIFDFQILFNKLPKGFQHICFDFSLNPQIDNELLSDLINVIKNNLQLLQKLTFNLIGNHVPFDQAQLFESLTNNRTTSVQIFMNQMKYEPMKQGSDREVELLKVFLPQKPNLINLYLNFSYGSVSDDGASRLAIAINPLINLNILYMCFSFGLNSIQDDGFSNLSQSILQMKNLSELRLLFGGGNNKIQNQGIIEFAGVIKKLVHLSNLNLCFSLGNHQINDLGFKYLADSLQFLKKLSTLTLYFSHGKNSISDDCIETLVESLKIIKRPLHFALDVKGGNNQVTNDGKEILKAAIKYASCEIIIQYKFTNLFFCFKNN